MVMTISILLFSSEVKETVLIWNIKLRVVFTDWSVRFRRSRLSAAQLERHRRGHDLAGGKSNQLLFKPFHFSLWRWYPKIYPESNQLFFKPFHFSLWRWYPKIPNDTPKATSYYSKLFTVTSISQNPKWYPKSNQLLFKPFHFSPSWWYPR